MRSIVTCLISIFFLLTSLVATATPKVGKAARPKWVLARNTDLSKEPKAREIDNGYYLQLYDEQVHIPSMTRYKRVVKKIINESGVQANSELYYAFAEAYQKIVFHDVSVVREGERIDKSDLGNIKLVNTEDGLGSHQLSGIYQAVLIIDDLRKGDVLNIEYSVVGANPIYDNKYSDRFIFSNDAPIMNYYTTVIMPAGRRLNYSCFNKAEEPKKSQSGTYEFYEWGPLELGAFDFPVNAPSWFMNFPYAELTEYNSREEVAAWALKVFNNYEYNLPAALKVKMAEWGKDTANKALFTIQAMRFVQDDVRYMGMEIGVNSHKPHLPAETYAKRYGDCKDKSILLATILRAQKIPGEVVLVSTVFRDHVNEHLPSPLLFDHVIVKTAIGGRTIYIDPTIPMQRGTIHRIQWPNYGDVLPVSSKTKHTEKMPVVDNGSISIWETFAIPAHTGSSGELRVVTDYEGSLADNMRNLFAESSLQRIEKYYEDHYKSIYTGTKVQGEMTYTDDDVHNKLTTQEYYLIDSIWQKSDGKRHVNVIAKQIYQRMTAPGDGESNYPLAQLYPVTMRYTATMQMPGNWSFPDDELSIVRNAYSFEFKPSVSNNIVTLEYRFVTYKDHIEAAEIAQYKKDYAKIVDVLQYKLSAFDNNVGSVRSEPIRNGMGGIYWLALFIAVITGGVVGLILWTAGKKSSAYTSQSDTPEQMSWWMIVLGIIIAIRVGIYLYRMLFSGYFGVSVWKVGGSSFTVLLWTELIAIAGFCAYSVWLFYWFIKKRDVFPGMFITLALSELSVNIVLLVLGIAFRKDIQVVSPTYISTMGATTVQSLLFCALWVSVVYASDRIKAVFIVPYRYMPTDEYEVNVNEQVPEYVSDSLQDNTEHNDGERPGNDVSI